MFIERLVALGREYLQGSPAELLRMISDVWEDGRFLQNVGIIEISLEAGFQAKRLPLQCWGEWSEKTIEGKRKTKTEREFLPERQRGLAIPFSRASSGNPKVPQGRYGVPVYLLFPRKEKKGKEEKPLNCDTFLSGRLERTMFLPRSFLESEQKAIAALIKEIEDERDLAATQKPNDGYGLVVLAIPGDGQPYRYSERRPPPGDPRSILLGESVLYPGKWIVADLGILAEQFRISKLEEGREMGSSDHCTLCGATPVDAVSAYCKSWSWLSATWHAPFPEERKNKDAIENLGEIVGTLCPDCYTALLLGAGVFSEVSGSIHQNITRELFLPVASAGGRRAGRGKAPRIQGAVLLLPLEIKPDSEAVLQDALAVYRSKTPRPGRRDQALLAITGFDGVLPEDFATDDYRLTMTYFTQSNADIHLRALIEDVLPSTVGALRDLLHNCMEGSVGIAHALEFTQTDRYQVLPYLLARAYGGSYLWKVLGCVLHREPVDWGSFLAGSAIRMNGYAREWLLGGDLIAHWNLKDEVYFYWLYRQFMFDYGILIQRGGMKLQDWKELLKRISEDQPASLCFEDPEELGFAAGYLVRLFGKTYYGKLKKDFLKHRVLSFGATLRPDDIWRLALSRFQEYAVKLDLHIEEDFRQRAAVVECTYRQMRDTVEKRRDAFIGAFWSGYMLAPIAAKEETTTKHEGGEKA